MPISEDTSEQRVAGPPSASTEWFDDVRRAKTVGRDDEALATPHTEEAPSAGRDVGGGGQSGTVQDPPPSLDGYLAKPWVPAVYQERGVQWLASRVAAALFLPPGMGKSSIALAAKQLVGQMGYKSRVLLLAPLTVCLTTWQTEPQKWRQFQGLKVGLAHGPDKELVLSDDYYDIVVLNYDGIGWAAPILAKGHNFQILLCDEIRRLKNTNSKRYKTLKPLLPSFTFRWGLTGTPAANGLMDLFGQCYVLDLGQRLGRFITHFRMKYFHQKLWDQYRYHITQEKAEELVAKISDIAMYMDPKEWLSLPPLLTIEIPVELDKETMRRYKDLENDFIIKLDSGVVTAANAGVLTSKLRQFTGGGVYSSTGVWDIIHSAKLDRLDELIDEMAGEPLMVAYQFEHEYERMIAKWPSALYIKGGMSKTKLAETVERWNTGEEPLLLIQPQAGSLGLNLQFGGSAICWFTQTYNLEDFIQQIARLLRRGQEKPVRNYMLNAKGTIDELISKIMVLKDADQNMVFNHLKFLGKV
jgi:SNF2 family DNA or RNA helicase